MILNSDVLYSKALRAEKLPTHVEQFLETCEKAAHFVVIPRTTLHEFDHAQERLREQEMNSLENAKSILLKYGISVGEFVSSVVVKRANLPAMLSVVGDGKLQFEIIDASLTDYESALQKACFHEAPHPQSGDSDEMRDLIIWELSKRIASENSGALLVSRDVVHTHHRGDVEAEKHNLRRAKNFEDALKILQIETPSAAVVKNLLEKSWGAIVASDLPLSQGAQLLSIDSVAFENTDLGTTIAEADAVFSSGQGKEIVTHLRATYLEDSPYLIEFSHVRSGSETHKDVTLRVAEEMMSNDVDLRLARLMEAIGADNGH